MSKYGSLFGTEVAPVDPLFDIKLWLNTEAIVTAPAKRINYIINQVIPANLKASDVSAIGHFNVSEATEANKCVDQVVTDFAALKDVLEPPKKLILEALSLIEGASKPVGFLARLTGFKENPDLASIRLQVKEKTTKALEAFKMKEQYQLNPFIEGLTEAKKIMDRIMVNLNDTISALSYVEARVSDPVMKDLVIRRKQMFVKSYSLSLLNKTQLDTMEKVCNENKSFIEELESAVIPIIENVIRTAVINGKDGLDEISTALKGIL
jgi:hypothetical protein